MCKKVIVKRVPVQWSEQMNSDLLMQYGTLLKKKKVNPHFVFWSNEEVFSSEFYRMFFL